MSYPRLLSSDLAVARSLMAHLPHPDAMAMLCTVLDNLAAARRQRGEPRQALSLETPVSAHVLDSLNHPMAKTALKELGDIGFPCLGERMRNEWITELTLADQSRQQEDAAVKKHFLAHINQQHGSSNQEVFHQALFPSDRDVVEALLPALDNTAAARLHAFLRQLDQITQERQQEQIPRKPQRLHDPEMQPSLKAAHQDLAPTLSPIRQMGFPRLAERLINEFTLEVRCLSQAHLSTPTAPNQTQLADILGARYQSNLMAPSG